MLVKKNFSIETKYAMKVVILVITLICKVEYEGSNPSTTLKFLEELLKLNL